MYVIQVGVRTKLTYEIEEFCNRKDKGVFECKNVLSIDASCP